MRRIECKLAKGIVFAHLHSIGRMWNVRRIYAAIWRPCYDNRSAVPVRARKQIARERQHCSTIAPPTLCSAPGLTTEYPAPDTYTLRISGYADTRIRSRVRPPLPPIFWSVWVSGYADTQWTSTFNNGCRNALWSLHHSFSPLANLENLFKVTTDTRTDLSRFHFNASNV